MFTLHPMVSDGSYGLGLEFQGYFDKGLWLLRGFVVVLQQVEVIEDCMFLTSDNVMHEPVVDVETSSPSSW